MNTTQLIVTMICALGGLALTFMGVFWLGARTGARAVARELIAQEVLEILGGADVIDIYIEADDDDDEDEGVAVPS
jgi:hypothetical protein